MPFCHWAEVTPARRSASIPTTDFSITPHLFSGLRLYLPKKSWATVAQKAQLSTGGRPPRKGASPRSDSENPRLAPKRVAEIDAGNVTPTRRRDCIDCNNKSETGAVDSALEASKETFALDLFEDAYIKELRRLLSFDEWLGQANLLDSGLHGGFHGIRFRGYSAQKIIFVD
jgi:hypothetical protein